ncbi:MAG TPA: hypothetical protein VFU05_13625 [Cyclobacteriaceae bacterium]|nr:hypothetical protein [Cyclobacteriaceae bacterium]
MLTQVESTLEEANAERFYLLCMQLARLQKDVERISIQVRRSKQKPTPKEYELWSQLK